MIFDRDGDQVISFKDFENTITGTLNMPMAKDELELYYQRVPQPFNFVSFDTMFKASLGAGTGQ